MSGNKKRKISGRRPTKDDFIEKGVSNEASTDEGEFPWDTEGVRDDVVKMFNLRLPEPAKLKLDYIGKANRSAHQFCLDVLLPAIDDEVRRLTDKSR